MPTRYPFHFVPVQAGSSDAWTERTALDAGAAAALTHDRYVAGLRSGRIVCRLTAESPIVVGAAREPHQGAAAEVSPYELEGRPAIPASSLRGLVSSIAEAASGSALRVLHDSPYSFRRRMEESLSAIGMIESVQGPDGPTLKLKPLTLPMVPPDQNAWRVADKWRRAFPSPNLRVYFGDAASIRSAGFTFQTWTPTAPTPYFLALSGASWDPEDPNRIVVASPHDRNGFLLGQKPAGGAVPRPTPGPEDTEGILRVLGCLGRDDIPNTKKHEVFVPFDAAVKEFPLLEIDPVAIERFDDLADQRTEDDPRLPFEPRGTARGGPDGTVRLKEGDLVFFDLRDDRGVSVVCTVSLSQIWRGRVEDSTGASATARTFFSAIDPELLPMSASRRRISPAEALFGFVETDRADEMASRRNRSLAGRVRFSSARAVPRRDGLTDYRDRCVTRILSSPKPPSPALYFKGNDGGKHFIAKSRLSPAHHRPQGRKFYLHHPAWAAGQRGPWETAVPDGPEARLDQKASVCPVREGSVFFFHVDFDNLTDAELGLLLFSVSPRFRDDAGVVDATFRHKIGMGKPIGLGTIRIDVEGVFLVDRGRRYSVDGLFGPRYAEGACVGDPAAWPDRYEAERAAVSPDLSDPGLLGLVLAASDAIAPDARTALRLLGDPAKAKGSTVRVPVVAVNQGQPESETFAWFVANERAEHPDSLEPLSAGSTRLPTLRDY